MNRSRTVLVLSGVLVVAAGVAVTVFLGRGHGESGAADVLRAPESGSAQSAVPAGLDAHAPRTAAELAAGELPAPPAVEPAAAALPLEPTRVLHGTVRMADGSKLPDTLTLHAQRRQPPPQLRTLRQAVGESSDAGDSENWREAVAAETDALTAEHAAHLDHSSAGTGAAGPTRTRRIARPEESTRTVVGADGRFDMAGVPESAVWLAVDDDFLYVDPAVRVRSGQDSVELLLVRGASLSGRITDASDAGVAGAELKLGTPFDPFSVFDTNSRMLEMEAEADAEGRYVVRQIPAGLKLLVAASTESGNRQPAHADLAGLRLGEQRVLDLSLPPGNVVAGVVEQPGTLPLADAQVHLRRLDVDMMNMARTAMVSGGRRDDAKTDADGRFRFEAAPDGSYEVVLGEDGWRQVHSEKIVLKGGIEVTDVVLFADPGLVIAGRVEDEAGQPVVGATVQGARPTSFTDVSAAMDGVYRQPATTDADGAFRLGGFDAGKQVLRVHAKGFGPGKQEVVAGDEHVLVTLAALTTVSGIVVSLQDGEPVTDFSVSLMPEGGLFDLANIEKMQERMGNLKGAQAFRDREDGTFTLGEVQPGTYDLTVTSAGFGGTLVGGLEVEKAGARGLVIMLPPEATLSGRVVSARDGLPVEGATVSTAKRGMLSAMTENLVGTGPEDTTDEDGNFSLGGLSGNTAVNLTVRHDSFRELAVPELVLLPGESRDLGALVLSVGCAVHGRVLDGSGRPVPDTVVMASSTNGASIKRSASDAEGRYRVEGLAPGSYTVMRMDFAMGLGGGNPADMMKDMVFRTVTLADNDDKELDLSAKGTDGTRLYGRVAASDGPVDGAMLTLLPDSGGVAGMQFSGCDKDGRYEFTGVAPGQYVLQVTVVDNSNAATSGQATSPVSEQLTVGGSPEQSHDVALPGGELHGSVENAIDGSFVAGVRVVLERTDAGRPTFGLAAATNGRVGESYTDSAGAFRFRFLPGGTYALVAGGQNIIGMGAKGWAQTRMEGLSVNSTGPGFGVRVKVRPAGSIEGTVRSTSGAPLANVGVWVADANGIWQSTLSEVASDTGGAYAVGSLQEGSWTLAFRDGEHALKLVPGVLVREGAVTQQDVRLEPGISLQLATGGHPAGALQVTLVGPDGAALPTNLVSMSEVMSLTDLGSALNLGTFAPGSYHLTVISGGETLLSTAVTLSGTKPKVIALDA